MKRITLAVTLLLASTLPITAQEHDHGPMMGTTIAQNSHRGTIIKLKSGNDTIETEQFLAMGVQRPKSPAVILIPEWWGLNDWVRDQARSLAASGFSVYTLDIYRGQEATDTDTAHQLSRALPHDRAVRDLESILHYIHAQTGPTSKVGVIGWCMGGGIALEFAIAEPNLQAVVVNYGSLPTDDATLSKIQAPVLGNFGAKDKGITPEMVAAFDKQMKALGKRVDVKEYADAGHAFQNENNKGGYNAADTADAKRRTLIFLNTQLRR